MLSAVDTWGMSDVKGSAGGGNAGTCHVAESVHLGVNDGWFCLPDHAGTGTGWTS